jgi:hypothetical protein
MDGPATKRERRGGKERKERRWSPAAAFLAAAWASGGSSDGGEMGEQSWGPRRSGERVPPEVRRGGEVLKVKVNHRLGHPNVFHSIGNQVVQATNCVIASLPIYIYIYIYIYI